MPRQINQKTIVVVSSGIDTLMYSQIWAVRNGVIAADDFEGEQICAPGLSKLTSRHLTILASSDRLQFGISDGAPPETVENVRAAINNAGNLSYTAIGMNFQWLIVPEGSLHDFSTGLFLKANTPLAQLAATDGESTLGGYLSLSRHGSALKVTARPGLAELQQGRTSVLIVDFNFHRDTNPENAIVELMATLDTWQNAHDESADIVRQLDEYVP